jgi:dihydrolipoamide dehydrogenase
MRTFDVAIIGAGTAGLSARREVARHTDNYVVIDDGPLGTTCARVGCMPSKVLIEVAKTFHRREIFDGVGIRGGDGLSVDGRAVMAHVRKLRDRFVGGVLRGSEEWMASKLLRGRARFVSPTELVVSGEGGEERISARSTVIATGSSPIVPGPWRALQHRLIDTDGFFELSELPESIAMIGLGVIGLELGQALARLGVKINVFTLDKRLGGLSSPKLQDYALELFRSELPIAVTGVDKLEERDGKLIVEAGGEELAVDKAFLAMGRRPNIAGLGLEEIGAAMNGPMPVFDGGTYRLGDLPIYLPGDANAHRPVLHEAADEGRIAGYNAVRDKDQCFRRRTALAITFSDPNIASLGSSYEQLVADGIDFVTGEVSYEGQGRAIVKLENKGILQVYAERQSGRLLGAELIAPEGEHLAHLLSWAVAGGLNAQDALSLPFYHPVLEEGVRTALRHAVSQLSLDRRPLETLRCQDPPVGCWD